jgi:hypothetical protein
LTVDPTSVFGRRDTPELSFDATFISSEQFDPKNCSNSNNLVGTAFWDRLSP